MSFMQPQIVEASAETETPQDDDFIVSAPASGPVVLCTTTGKVIGQFEDEDSAIRAARAQMDRDQFWPNIWRHDERGSRELIVNDDHEFSGYAWRLSAPGYLDCTDWSHADSVVDCVHEMLSIHGDTFDLEDYRAITEHLEGFSEFFYGVLLGLALTGHKEGSPDDSVDEPIFTNPGGDISDVVDTDDLEGKIAEVDLIELYADAITFFLSALPLISDRFQNAGSDFHLTRNGHGAGFWDGDWEHSDKLAELSKPYGTCELVARDDGTFYIA